METYVIQDRLHKTDLLGLLQSVFDLLETLDHPRTSVIYPKEPESHGMSNEQPK
jgi:hypothetical protein